MIWLLTLVFAASGDTTCMRVGQDSYLCRPCARAPCYGIPRSVALPDRFASREACVARGEEAISPAANPQGAVARYVCRSTGRNGR